MAEHAEPERPQRMWKAVLAATSIAVIGAGAFAGLSGGESTDPAKFRELGPEWAMGQEAMFAFAIPAVAVLVTWLLFLVLVFRKHRWWKSVVALLIMAPVTTLVAVPARIISFTWQVYQDDEAAWAWREEARARIRTLREPLFTEEGEVRLMRGMPPPETAADVDRYLAEVRDARERFQTYRTAIDAELRSSRQALADLDIFEGSKLEHLAWYDNILAPDSNTQKHLAATARLIELQERAYTYLDEHRSQWTIRDGRFGFYSDAQVDEFRAITDQLYETDAQIDFLNGAMGREWDDVSRLPEAPPQSAN